jgi:hypothetical protein
MDRPNDIEVSEFEARGGDDSPPLVNKVADPPPAGWGKLTGTARTLSPAYLRFLSKGMEADGGHR